MRVTTDIDLKTMYVKANNNPNVVARLDYDENLRQKVEAYTWTYVEIKKSRYFKNGDRNYYLQYLAVDHFYGEEVRLAFKERGFVIDHINNDGLNNMIDNLQFLLSSKNSSKGQTTDKAMREGLYQSRFGVNMCRDFKTGLYLLAVYIIDEFLRIDMVYDSFEVMKRDIDTTLQEIRETNKIKGIFETQNYLAVLFRQEDKDLLTKVEEVKKEMSDEERKRGGFKVIEGELTLIHGDSVLSYKPKPFKEIIELLGFDIDYGK